MLGTSVSLIGTRNGFSTIRVSIEDGIVIDFYDCLQHPMLFEEVQQQLRAMELNSAVSDSVGVYTNGVGQNTVEGAQGTNGVDQETVKEAPDTNGVGQESDEGAPDINVMGQETDEGAPDTNGVSQKTDEEAPVTNGVDQKTDEVVPDFDGVRSGVYIMTLNDGETDDELIPTFV